MVGLVLYRGFPRSNRLYQRLDYGCAIITKLFKFHQKKISVDQRISPVSSLYIEYYQNNLFII
jgi:hypothetical protein